MKNSTSNALIIIVALCYSMTCSGQSPVFNWALAYGGNSSDDGRALDTDAAGNVYVSGTFSGTIDLDPGPAVQSFNTNGNDDVFIQKFDASGLLIWAAKIGGPGEDVVRDIHITDNGDILLVGRFESSADFDPGPGVHTVNAHATKDAFLLRMNSDGEFIWLHHIGDLGWSDGRAVGEDDNGDLYFTGSFQANPDFDPGPGTAYIPGVGYSEIFIQKLTANGDHIWAKGNVGSQPDNGRWLTVAGNGDLILSGRFQSTTDFDPGPAVQQFASIGDADGYVQKLNANGDLQWIGTIGGTGEDMFFHHATDDLGNSYLTGWFNGTADLDPTVNVDNRTTNGDRDIMVVKVDQNGAVLWIRTIGGSGEDLARSIAVDGQQNVYVTGRFHGTVDFDPGAGTTNLTSYGDADAFHLILDINGNYIWAGHAGGTDFDDGFDIHLDHEGDLYLTGGHTGVADLDPTTGTSNVTASGVDDIHLIKLRGIITSTEEGSFASSFSLFPNPTTDAVSLLVDRSVDRFSLELIDVHGRILESAEYRNTQRVELNMEYAPGVYTIRIHSKDQGSASIRVVKE